jgi:hypothetical protein
LKFDIFQTGSPDELSADISKELRSISQDDFKFGHVLNHINKSLDNFMQSYADIIRESVWGKLNDIFVKYTGGKATISSDQIGRIVVEVIKETDQDEIDYVLRNLFRLDTDGNGSIDFA